MPTASRNAARQTAQSVIANGSGGSEDSPAPGASQATTVNRSDSSSNSRRHTRESQRKPWRSTNGGPFPADRYAMDWPPISTRADAVMVVVPLRSRVRQGYPGRGRECASCPGWSVTSAGKILVASATATRCTRFAPRREQLMYASEQLIRSLFRRVRAP